MSPYFLLSFVSLQSEEAARGLLCSQRSEERLILFISGRLFATGEISGDGMWSHHDSDEEEDECQVVNPFNYFLGVLFFQSSC